MTIEAWGKTYEIEFTFEAAHYRDCVQKAWDFYSGIGPIRGAVSKELSDNETVNQFMLANSLLDSMVDVPDMVLTFLYAGLLEHHSDEITCERDARDLYKQFGKEHPNDERSMDFGMMNALRDQMEKDGFFRRIGLAQFLDNQSQGTETKKAPKTPQDHKAPQK